MDIRGMKVWLKSRLVNDAAAPLATDTVPDCICIPAKAEDNADTLPALVHAARIRFSGLPVFLICEPISRAYNVAQFCEAAGAGPDGIILRGVENVAQIQMAETLLRLAEARADRTEGAIALIAMIGDNGAGLLNAGHFVRRPGRVIALGYDAANLCSGLAGSGDIGRHGAVATMMAARMLGIPAIDFTRDNGIAETFDDACRFAANTGFSGKLAENNAHIGAIKAAFAAP
ncbi:hypothetical protein FJU08_13570 [Martelella alba]|uniref:Uncharacterized protein n=1 Tax=Martelella alba TaxID=2590451 RepID=A0A506U612_9HYPH|nr:hypothetical protein [Martelella alba]TPW29822.1 hypothetical protein FJU08_13570 [Martelella alba]